MKTDKSTRKIIRNGKKRKSRIREEYLTLNEKEGSSLIYLGTDHPTIQVVCTHPYLYINMLLYINNIIMYSTVHCTLHTVLCTDHPTIQVVCSHPYHYTNMLLYINNILMYSTVHCTLYRPSNHTSCVFTSLSFTYNNNL